MYKTRVCKTCKQDYMPVSSTQSLCGTCRMKCKTCPAPKVGKGSYCSACTVVLAKSRKESRIANNVCVDCNTRPPEEGCQRCENCMLDRSILSATKYRACKKRAVDYLGGKCTDCGIKTDRVEIYDFHHLDPSTKEDGVGDLLRASWETMRVELDKCVVLCCNCHRTREADIDINRLRSRCESAGYTIPLQLAA